MTVLLLDGLYEGFLFIKITATIESLFKHLYIIFQ